MCQSAPGWAPEEGNHVGVQRGQGAVALSLLEGQGGLGSDGATPSTSDVIGDSPYAGFAR